ncbi:chromatin assembly factor 1 subunit A-domain-containing protein [Talaromyces proteolyticus]|uniref:Chromatin assembly factor 1 subunit A-domain-containing protein n=1 Tax=Talaromyces proteolyticus TaxID=1131652 RepID=A0AAD4Q401_9EURO|nr:chromatin assembly factor 1 subunit A-domain-containing protein [Talaromyces proteolyticus]KAH8702187.1 chromatin assembly factor 1 subunit A-domain-containing protein [Talaromyces proteolyticus]
MDVSIEPAPSPVGQTFPPSATHSRKRAFSEVDEPNISKPDIHKYQKHGNLDEQENRNPLGPGPMLIDKPSVTTTMNIPVSAAVDTNTTAATSTNTITQNTGRQKSTPTPGQIPQKDTQSPAPSTPQPPSNAVPLASANKKQKLSPNAKEAKRLEKEEKDRLRLEEKAKKDEEKRVREEERKKKEAEKEEEKKKREAEREEKKRAREEEKQAKEEEKRKKEEEKEKKARSQMRLSSFFTKPPADKAKSPDPSESSPHKNSTRDVANSPTPGIGTETVRSDYHSEFPEFFIHENTQLAPPHRFQRDENASEHIREKLDGFLKQTDARPVYRSADLFDMIPYRRRKGRHVVPIKTIIQKLQDEGNVDASRESIRHLLRKTTMKSLKFGEDVRPAYYGTFTKPLSNDQATKLCRRPYARTLPDINYDYDSEAEWEEPEEGEDLDSEGEEEMSEDGEDDMDGFLDDEEEQIEGRRRLIIGDLEPVCTGIKWDGDGDIDPAMEAYRIEAISDTMRFPIYPFSTAYWPKPKAVEQTVAKGHTMTSARGTLHAFSTAQSTQSQTPLATVARPSISTESAIPSKVKKPFPPEQLDAFKEAVEGSDLTKAGLIEVLKKRFPKISKDVLKETLNLVAVRVGQKEADKKWVCK